MNRTTLASSLLLGLGLLQMIGYLTGIQPLRALGAASSASPLPLVFSDVKGLETFASEFSVKIETENHSTKEFFITPELYSRLKGAYNRRNVYGAALSYAPRLPEKLWQSVFRYGFCEKGPLAEAFQVNEPIQKASLHIRTKTRGREDVWDLPVLCKS